MGKIERARELRMVIEQLAETLEDTAAIESVELFPQWDANSHEYSVGDRVRDGGVLYKVVQTHTSQADWTPENAPSLFAKVLPGQEGTEIGEWVQPDSTNPYMTGDRVMFNGRTYESTIDGNVWSPVDYPAGWKEIL